MLLQKPQNSYIQFLLRGKKKEISKHSRQNQYMKISIYWDITVRSPWKIKRLFGGICRLHF
jgi:hypothetical protein